MTKDNYVKTKRGIKEIMNMTEDDFKYLKSKGGIKNMTMNEGIPETIQYDKASTQRIEMSDKPFPVMDIGTKRGRYFKLKMKPIGELTAAEFQEYTELKNWWDEQELQKQQVHTAEEKLRIERKIAARKEYVTSGDQQERFFKFMDECMQRYIFTNTPLSRNTSLKRFRALVEEYGLAGFFK